MYNKRKFNKINDKKVLHKVKKQWVTISLALLMIIGGGALATHTDASADVVNNDQDQQQVSVQLGSKRGSITNQAKRHTLADHAVQHNIKRPKLHMNNRSNQPQVNNHYAKNINNVNYLKVYQSGVYKHYVAERIRAPFSRIRINRPVYLHSSIAFNHGHIMGKLDRGQVVKFNKVFKQFGFYHNYLRYEIRLTNKRNAFITGSQNSVSYFVSNRNYRYYQKRINKLLKHTQNNTKLVKRFNKLNKQRKHNLNKYVGLYEAAYNAQQNQKHPVIINYHNKVAKINNHRKRVNYRNKRSIKQNLNSLVNRLETGISANLVSANSTSVSSVASSSVSPDNVPAYVAPINNTPITPSASSAASTSSGSTSSVTSNSVSSSASTSAKPSSASVSPSSANSKSASSTSKLNSSKASVESSSAVKPSKASSAVVKPSSASKVSSSSSKSTSSKANVRPGSKSNAESSSASASVKPSSAATSNHSKASAKSNSVAKSVSSKATKPSSKASARSSFASKSVMPSSKASTTSSKASSARSTSSKAASNESSASSSSVNSVSANTTEIVNTTFSDINKERKQNGVAPLSLNSQLQSVASMRANQLTRDFNHYNKRGQLYNELDAKQVAPKFAGNIGENISMATLGKSYEDGTNAEDHLDPILYNNHNGKDMANMMNDGMMNWDYNKSNGHRENILNNHYITMGLGVAYSPKSNRYYLAEDFSYLQ